MSSEASSDEHEDQSQREREAETALKEAGIGIVGEDKAVGPEGVYRVVGERMEDGAKLEALGDDRASALLALLTISKAT